MYLETNTCIFPLVILLLKYSLLFWFCICLWSSGRFLGDQGVKPTNTNMKVLTADEKPASLQS